MIILSMAWLLFVLLIVVGFFTATFALFKFFAAALWPLSKIFLIILLFGLFVLLLCGFPLLL